MSSNDKMIHGQSGFQPNYFPLEGPELRVQIDRAQGFDPTLTRNREKIEELGQDAVVEYLPQTPSGGITLNQKEYGSIEWFNALANLALDNDTIELTDYKSASGAYACYLTNDDNVFVGTLYMPDYRLNGFSVNINDPQSSIDRSFDLVGEKCWLLKDNNKQLIPFTATVATGEDGVYDIVFGSGDFANYPTPVLNPNVAGQYIFYVVRVRSGVSTCLTLTTDYTYTTGTATLSILDAEVGDIYKGVYSAGSYITGSQPFTANTTDKGAILANSASIYLSYSNYLYKLQSVTIDVSFDRQDNYEIGNKDVIQRGINNRTVTVTLGKLQDIFTQEEVLSGQTDIIDFENMSDDAVLTVLLYEDYTKASFKMGFKIPNLSVSEVRPGTANLNAYLDGGETLESEQMTITTVLATLQS